MNGSLEAGLTAQSTVIVAFRNEVVADVYGLAFESVFGSKVITCADAKSAAAALRSHPSACVIIETAIPGGPLNAFFACQASLAKRAHVFVLGGDKNLLPGGGGKIKVEFLGEQPQMRDVVARVEAVLKLAESAQEYCRISLKSLLVRSAKLRCDVYLKLGPDKYVKVLHADDRFDDAEYGRFQEKKVDFLYLPRKDFLGLMDDLLAKVAELNENPEKLTVDSAVNANMAIFQVVHTAFDTDGFTPLVQELAMSSVKLATNTIKKNPKLSELLSRFDQDRDSYLSWHSTALSFLSCKLATLLDWQSESTFYKLSLASMLHDIVLPSDELAKIQTMTQLKEANLSEQDRAAILRHPVDAAQILQHMEEIPGEVAFIVEQHHELPDGTGFPRGVDHKDISSIAALFVIAHDIVTSMFDAPPQNFKMVDFLSAREIEKRYSKGAFGQVFRALLAKRDEM